MGRWKPPSPPSSPYITAAGFAALQAELRSLWERRSEVVTALAAAAAEGDRSENAEYIYRKKELGGIDRRIRYLQKRLPVLKVVCETPATDGIYFGAHVKLAQADGSEVTYRIVGPDEADASRWQISIDSPLARSLLKKRIGESCDLTIGNHRETMVILDIRYELSDQLSPPDDV